MRSRKSGATTGGEPIREDGQDNGGRGIAIFAVDTALRLADKVVPMLVEGLTRFTGVTDLRAGG